MRIDRILLIAEMARQGVTVKKLADAANVSAPTISAMRGGKSVRSDTAQRVAAVLGISIKELEG